MGGKAGQRTSRDAPPVEQRKTIDLDDAVGQAFGLQQQGRLADARALYLKILQIAPDHFQSLQHLGILEAQSGRMAAAEPLLRKATDANPASADARANHGNVLCELGRFDEALASYDKAIGIDPANARAHNGRGNVLARLRRYDDMVPCYDRALALKPDYVEALCNRGAAHCQLSQFDNAIADYERAIAINARHVAAWFGLCDVHFRMKRYAAAIDACASGLALNPHSARGIKQLGLCHEMMGNIEDAVTCFRQSLALAPADENTITVLIFALDLLPSVGFAEHQEVRRIWQQQIGSKIDVKAPATFANVRDPERRLVLGYVSGDFRDHSAAFAIRPVLRNHDKSRFEVICYANSSVEDAVTGEFMGLADQWRNTWRLTDEALAQQIRDDKVDILIDLSGHTEGNRLRVFAGKAAPVQVSAWGHGSGTGLPAIDYLFSDPVLIPREVRALFAETIFDLPCAATIEPPPDALRPVDPPLLANGYVTYGVFNRISKVSDESVRVWAQILAADPRSRLVFKHPSLADASVRNMLGEKLARHHIPGDRCDLMGGTSRAEHLKAMSGIDIGLDPFPQNGGVSTWEMVYMGVPVVAKLGHGVPSRISAAILSSIGLREWIADNDDDYAAIALKFAAMPERLSELRHALPGMIASSASGNNAAYTRAVEDAYRTIWRNFCQGTDAAAD